MKYLLTLLALLCPMWGYADSKVVNIYLDADFSNHEESSQSIRMGIELAFSELNNEIEGYEVALKPLDHRGNVVRSKRNFQTYINDPDALVIFSGIHSPPLIKNRDFINQEKILTLVPWAAGGSITRYPSAENWIFRLSVDDTRAGPVIVDYTLNTQGCTNPQLLLEQTPWGDSNLRSMTKALEENGINNVSVTRFNWNLKNIGARSILRDIVSNGADCIVLVANSGEAEVIIGEMLSLPIEYHLPIISHWGITGGNFPEVITAADREKLELHFIQTCFAFTNDNLSQFARQVFSNLKNSGNEEINNPSDLKSAVGLIHAYDLSKILIQAILQAGITGDPAIDRNAIRIALEKLRNPVEGLVKTYNAPFSVFDEVSNFNAHEALDEDSYCMAEYGPGNEILILRN